MLENILTSPTLFEGDITPTIILKYRKRLNARAFIDLQVAAT